MYRRERKELQRIKDEEEEKKLAAASLPTLPEENENLQGESQKQSGTVILSHEEIEEELASHNSSAGLSEIPEEVRNDSFSDSSAKEVEEQLDNTDEDIDDLEEHLRELDNHVQYIDTSVHKQPISQRFLQSPLVLGV